MKAVEDAASYIAAMFSFSVAEGNAVERRVKHIIERACLEAQLEVLKPLYIRRKVGSLSRLDISDEIQEIEAKLKAMK